MLSNPNQIAILAYVLNNKRTMTYQELKAKTRLTDGNLSGCITQLEKNGLVTVSKFFIGKKPCTNIIATEQGENSLLEYANWFNKLIEDFETVESQ
jgi:DNA-binding MarR family transcriptional regulator